MEANAFAGADNIELPAGTYAISISGAGEDESATGDFDITDDLTITGAGSDITVIHGSGLDRVIQITAGNAVVEISDITILGGLIQGQGFENVGDETYIYYGAWDPRPGLDFEPRGGVGLATLPRDRLGSLSPIDETGDACLVTSAVENDGAMRLQVNADGLSADTWLSIELLDAQERPLRIS